MGLGAKKCRKWIIVEALEQRQMLSSQWISGTIMKDVDGDAVMSEAPSSRPIKSLRSNNLAPGGVLAGKPSNIPRQSVGAMVCRLLYQFHDSTPP